MMMGPDGIWNPAPLDASGEAAMSESDWLAASDFLIKILSKIHGERLGNHFAAHFAICRDIAQSNSFELSLRYDIQQRKAFAFENRHDFSTLDEKALSVCASTLALDMSKAAAAAVTYHSQPKVVTKRPFTPVYQQNTSVANSYKRPRHAATQSHNQSHCFRCGKVGHIVPNCTETTTTAGKPSGPLTTRANGRVILTNAAGTPYCFAFARSSFCPFEGQGRTCSNHHGCSICFDPSHGAGRCPTTNP